MRLKRVEGMNIIPFIDIMLVLLAIVLTLSTFIAGQKMRIELPTASSSEAFESKVSHEIVVNPDNTIAFDANPLSQEALEEALSTLGSEDLIVLKADKQSNFGVFIAIVDLMKKNNHTNVDIVVKRD